MARNWAALKVALLLTFPAVAASAAECRLAILGDSLTAGYGVAVDEGFPARLALALDERGVACEVVDAGVSGDTSAGGLGRLDWVLGDRPTHLLVELGGNDALRALPPDQLRRNLDDIVGRAEAAGVQVMLAGMLAPPNLGAAYGKEFADAFTTTAAAHDVPLYPFFLDGVAGEPDLVQRDGVHPNAAGVEIIVERILPSLISWLQSKASGGAS
ncbi:MAG TPA: arylesterase [Geminicoccaceae bacterium]|nr:arylesterase [Geminicoccus sp.]HMU52974.1 arylesterase [Geminicoccaceae bacterium]